MPPGESECVTYSTPTLPQTSDLLDAEELGAPTEPGARPDLKAPPSSPPVDRDALDHALDVYSRVKPY
jgi:hypothetical protein